MENQQGTFQGVGPLELFYQRWQPSGELRAVLSIVHGFGEHSGRYMNVVNYLVPRGYAVYGFDLRGHGRSPGQRGYLHTWEEFREDVRAFLQRVAGQEPDRPLFLMGHSMGGLIVLDYVLHHPEGLRGVIVSAPPLARIGVSPFLLTLSRILSRVWPRFSMDSKLDAAAISRDPAVVKAYREDPLVHSRGTARLGAEIIATQQWINVHAADLRLPLLMIHGSADRLASPEGSRSFYEKVTSPDKERHEYEGGYHESHNDIISPQVLADIERWLERHL